jgi:hypothetical protein
LLFIAANRLNELVIFTKINIFNQDHFINRLNSPTKEKKSATLQYKRTVLTFLGVGPVKWDEKFCSEQWK